MWCCCVNRERKGEEEEEEKREREGGKKKAAGARAEWSRRSRRRKIKGRIIALASGARFDCISIRVGWVCVCVCVFSIRWDEGNLEDNEKNKTAKMKIDEPPTPYRYDCSDDDEEEEGGDDDDDEQGRKRKELKWAGHRIVTLHRYWERVKQSSRTRMARTRRLRRPPTVLRRSNQLRTN